MFLYKRAQIFVGDLWGAFRGKGLGKFNDIGQLTTFADYRVPVVLRELGILNYTNSLTKLVGCNPDDLIEQLPPHKLWCCRVKLGSLSKAICSQAGAPSLRQQ